MNKSLLKVFLLVTFVAYLAGCTNTTSTSEKVANISIRLGVNTTQRDPTSVTTFDTRNLESKRYPSNKNIHFLVSFFATANLSNYQQVAVRMGVPHQDDLLIFFQFGVHTPRMEIDGDTKWFYFDFGLNSNQAFVFSMLPLQPMIVPLVVESIHDLTGFPNGIPVFEVYEETTN